MKKIFLSCAAVLLSLSLFSGCYSVFSGGTGGLVVDGESTSNPKAGIANVEVYAYTERGDRDSDFNRWVEGTTFAPAASYYGHTTTAGDGSFTMNKLTWKAEKPEFGRDGDFTHVFLLFYHENYGLTKGETIITSDSYSDTVYQELVSIRKTTVLNINVVDVASNSNTNESVQVKVFVPQSTEKNPDIKPKEYKSIITGTGNISVSYPRWKNSADKIEGVENTPTVKISYEQNSDLVTWKACLCDDENADYSFLPADAVVEKTVRNNDFSIRLYGKNTKLYVPSVSGTAGDTSLASSDGKKVTLKGKDASGNFTVDLGEDETKALTAGTAGNFTHGNFSGLGGNKYYWYDEAYTDRYSTYEVQLSVEGGTVKTYTLRSDKNSNTFSL